MSTTKRIFLRVIPIVLVIAVIVSNNVFAFSSFTTNSVNTIETAESTTANNAVKKIWGTVMLILQILAVAAIVLAGVRYMFSSAEAKADIKKQTVALVVGAILVFGATTVVNFIVNVTNDITGTTTNNTQQ